MEFKLFPSFFDKPQKVKYCQQEEDEVIELFLRKHWIVNVPWVLISFTLLILPLVIFKTDEILKSGLFASIPLSLFIGGLTVWYIVTLTYALESFIFWYFNIYIVTNKHLIDVNFSSLLYRDITEIELDDIETISTRVQGVLGPLFNFGNVFIETAAEKEAVEFNDISVPDFVADRIQDLQGMVKNG